jgi:coenzyme F420-reducing hydrogenase delta subunit
MSGIPFQAADSKYKTGSNKWHKNIKIHDRVGRKVMIEKEIKE